MYAVSIIFGVWVSILDLCHNHFIYFPGSFLFKYFYAVSECISKPTECFRNKVVVEIQLKNRALF